MPGSNEQASSWKTIVERTWIETKGFLFAEKAKNLYSRSRMIYSIMNEGFSCVKREEAKVENQVRGDIESRKYRVVATNKED